MSRPSRFLPGLVLILLGAWILARNLGVSLPAVDALWPLFPIIFGLWLLYRYFRGERRDPDAVSGGVLFVLAGCFFFLFTWGRWPWSAMGTYWPVFILIAGVAGLAEWLAQPARRGQLLSALIALIVGGVALIITAGGLDPALRDKLINLWPILIIAAGVGVLIERRRRAS